MKQKLIVEFTKMNGAGNDFIVIDNRFYHFSDGELTAIARAFCPRRTGIGSDGVLALAPPTTEKANFRMRYLNADGSIGTMCGNGARCLARFARLGGIEAEPLVFETDAGIHTASVPDVRMPDVEISLRNPRDYHRLEGLDESGEQMSYVWTGTEHAVTFVEDVEVADVARRGPELRRHDVLQPAGANVNFVEVRPGDSLRVRTYEKGVEEETLACGTGAVASAVAAYLAGRTSETQLEVEMPGGKLMVSFDAVDGDVTNVRLRGPAEVVFRGTF